MARLTGHVDSYYAASANPAPERPTLAGEVRADICVIGGGYSGLSAAITLAEYGYNVVLLEAHKIGWGASGRNGGQIVNGLNASLDKIERQFGSDIAHFVGGIAQEGASIIRERVARYAIQCDLKEKNLFAAFNAKHMRGLESMQSTWRKHGMDDFEILDSTDIRAHVGTDAYAGGMIDHKGGHMHPLNLALGHAAALEQLGGQIYENSAVTKISYSSGKPLADTGSGSVLCDHLVICGNAYLDTLVPALTLRVLPVSTQVLATEPLGEDIAKALLPSDICVEDCRYILDYYRLSADRRLVFGGGTIYGGRDASNVVRRLRPNMLRLFPNLTDVRISHAWNGNFALSFSRVPQMGQLSENTWFAHGYSGHGVTGSHLFGKIIAEAINGQLSRFDVFASLPWVPFPGGRLFGPQYSALGAWYYGLRDKLGF